MPPVTYIPPELPSDINELFQDAPHSGLNFDKYDDIPVKVTGKGSVSPISSFEEAQFAISCSYYSPKGERGLSPYTSAFNYNHDNSDIKKKKINKKIFIGLLIEGLNGLNALEKICSKLHQDISLIYFGLYDFTNSLKLKPTWQSPKVKQAVEKIVKICNKKNIKVGSIARNFDEIKLLKKIGINFICYQNDTGIIYNAFSKIKKV